MSIKIERKFPQEIKVWGAIGNEDRHLWVNEELEDRKRLGGLKEFNPLFKLLGLAVRSSFCCFGYAKS